MHLFILGKDIIDTIIFGTKAREEPGFELTKPSTGQDYKDNRLQRKEKRTERRIQGTQAKQLKAAAKTLLPTPYWTTYTNRTKLRSW